MYKKILKSLFTFSIVFSLVFMYISSKVPDNLYINYGEDISIGSIPIITFKPMEKEAPSRQIQANNEPLIYSADFLGVFPMKEVVITQTEQRFVSVSGKPFGIKMFCDGVMVVGFSDILTNNGYQNPAKLAGLKIGDIILSMNDEHVQTNEDVEKIIKSSENKPIKITYLRDDEQRTTILTTVRDVNIDSYRSGMWVRDSGAGIGTMTFYDCSLGYFAGLGHGIKDVDTHKELRLLSGEIVPVKITGLVKSKNGSAGRLKGSFTSSIANGQVLYNGETGVYGKAYSFDKDNFMPVATPAEIETGPAYILTTINGTFPQKYQIEIEKVNLTSNDPIKNMVIRITDPKLLSLTGGILRGFSGSPIIQNGKLVGAVTHVFVNQVDRGYGIFAYNMLNTMDSVAEKQGKKVA